MTLLTPARRKALDRALLAAAVLVPLAAAGAALMVEGWPARRYLAFYTAPFFVALFAWARLRLREPHDGLGVLAVDGAMLAASSLRLASPAVPWSGHMVFFTYTALTTRSRPYLALGLALAALTTWFKLALWGDAWSWTLGVVLGAFLAARRAVIHRKKN